MIAVDLFRSLLDDGDVPRGEVFEADKLHMLSENGRSWHMPGVQSCLRSFSLLDERWAVDDVEHSLQGHDDRYAGVQRLLCPLNNPVRVVLGRGKEAVDEAHEVGSSACPDLSHGDPEVARGTGMNR